MAKMAEVQIGDKIKVTKITHSAGKYEVGDELTVKGFFGTRGVVVEEFSAPFVDFEEFEVIGQEEPPKPEVGDIIVLNEEGFFVTKGESYEIIRVDSDGDIYVNDDEDDEYLIDEDFTLFKRVTPTTTPKPAYEPQVGDIVELTTDKPRYGFGSAEQGDIGVIVSVTEGRANVRFPRHNYFTALPEELTLLAKAENREVIGGE